MRVCVSWLVTPPRKKRKMGTEWEILGLFIDNTNNDDVGKLIRKLLPKVDPDTNKVFQIITDENVIGAVFLGGADLHNLNNVVSTLENVREETRKQMKSPWAVKIVVVGSGEIGKSYLGGVTLDASERNRMRGIRFGIDWIHPKFAPESIFFASGESIKIRNLQWINHSLRKYDDSVQCASEKERIKATVSGERQKQMRESNKKRLDYCNRSIKQNLPPPRSFGRQRR